MAAQSKLELILEMRNRMKTGFSRAKEQVSGGVGKMKKELSSVKDHAARSFGAMKDQIPGLASGLELLTNRYVLMAAATVALATGLGKATMKAADFNHTFLDIRQLNLDKSEDTLTSYRQQVLDTAFDTGIAGGKMSTAFYDIQSGLGIFGDDVAQINKKLGDFSVATKADFGDSVNATIKAMAAFGFGVNELDAYLASNAKTVQVGITTFKDLAMVQTEYAGSAAAAGQSIDTANKLFATFTQVGKDSATSATLTKAAFQGITQKATIDGLKKIGVSLFDSKGQMRDLTHIIADTIPLMQKMTDAEFAKLKADIGGPEGLQSLFNQMKSSGDTMLSTFDAFDKSAFDITKALRNAKGDFNTLKEIVGNRLNVVMVELGTHILPIVARGLDWISRTVVAGRSFFQTYGSEIKTGMLIARDTIIGVSLALAAIYAPAAASFLALKVGALTSAAASWTLAGSIRAIGLAITAIPIIGWIALLIGGLTTAYHTSDKFRASIHGIMGALKEMLTLAKPLAQIMGGLATGNYALVGQGVSDLKKAWSDMDIKGAFNSAFDDTLAERRASTAMTPQSAEVAAGGAGAVAPGGEAGGTSTFAAGSASGMETGSAPVRNITVNIESFVKELTVRKDGNLQAMSESELETWFNEKILRTIRNVEVSAS